MENTAKQLSAEQVVKEFQTAHNSLDLLRVFLITGTADINRSYEFITKLNKNASKADKARFNNALQILVNIELKRVELTNIIYNANGVQLPEMTAAETTEEPEGKTIMMLPALDDILNRAKAILVKGSSIPETKEVFELLKTTVGQGKVLNSEGKIELWDNERINIFIAESTPEIEDIVEETKAVSPYGFGTIYNIIADMIKNDKDEAHIKLLLKEMLIGKIIAGKTVEDNYLIKDVTIFEQYYIKMLQGVVQVGLNAHKAKSSTPETKAQIVEKQIEDEIIPALDTLDKDETQASVAPVVKPLRDIYTSQGLKMTLKDAWLKARELAETWAPNLLGRSKEGDKTSVPVVDTTKTETVEDNKAVEIYDESHNIRETNKELWAEVEKYEYQLFTKASELAKAGNWRDALSMSTILISSGKIKETTDSTETLKWEVDQIKLWYYNVVEASANASTPTIDAPVEVITDNSNTNESGEKSIEAAAESSESSPESGEKIEKVKQGPVPQAGTIDSKESLSRLLKDNSQWKDTYKFKSFPVKTDHHSGGAMSLEIVDATNDQLKDLLIIEENMTKFFDGLIDRLVKSRNCEKDVRKVIIDTLSPFYTITSAEAKRICGGLLKDADGIRKAAKQATKMLAKTAEPTVSVEPTTPEVVVPETATPEPVTPTEVTVPLVEPVVPEESVESDVKPETPSTENSEKDITPVTTEVTAGESTVNTNENPQDAAEPVQQESVATTIQEPTVSEQPTEQVSSNDASYEGFEDMLKSKNKHEFHKSMFAKISEYQKSEEGIKAVYDVVNLARKDKHYKKYYVRNHINAQPLDLLNGINNVYTAGVEIAKRKE
jgi:hypothetical protein